MSWSALSTILPTQLDGRPGTLERATAARPSGGMDGKFCGEVAGEPFAL